MIIAAAMTHSGSFFISAQQPANRADAALFSKQFLKPFRFFLILKRFFSDKKRTVSEPLTIIPNHKNKPYFKKATFWDWKPSIWDRKPMFRSPSQNIWELSPVLPAASRMLRSLSLMFHNLSQMFVASSQMFWDRNQLLGLQSQNFHFKIKNQL